MKVEAESIEELFSKSEDQKSNLERLDKFIQKTAPVLDRKLYKGPSITMIGYGEMPWKNKSGEGVWPLIGLAPQKGSSNLYIAADREGKPLPQYYGKRLGKVSLGKNCIRVKNFDHLELPVLEDLIRDALDRMQNEVNRNGRDCAKPV